MRHIFHVQKCRHLQVLSQKLLVPGSTGQSCVCPWRFKTSKTPGSLELSTQGHKPSKILDDWTLQYLTFSLSYWTSAYVFVSSNLQLSQAIFHICILISTNFAVLLSDLPTLSQTPPPRCEQCPPPEAWIPCRVPIATNGTSFIGAPVI